MDKLVGSIVWPDPDVLWVPAAFTAAVTALRARPADAILVFMMPYSSGLLGVALGAATGLPLILNFDDSPTCSDMHPWFLSSAHHWLAYALEDFYIRRADAVIYVSETTRARVAARLPPADQDKLRLIRYGADRAPGCSENGDVFSIRYIGGMTGWNALLESDPVSPLRRVYRKWMALGRSHAVAIDHRTSSPVFIGRAVKRILARHPEWRNRLRVEIFGNSFPISIVQRVLALEGLQDIVSVNGSVSYDEAVKLTASAEQLFLTLPGRPDGSEGGRISAKSYEYLTTDRPIIAAVPPGENFEFMTGRPGVDCCDPTDEEQMERFVERAAAAFFSGRPERFDRQSLLSSISYRARTEELARLLEEVISGAGRKGDGVPSLRRRR